MLVLTASLAVAQAARPDNNACSDDVATEQASVSGKQVDEAAATTPGDLGVTNYAAHGGGVHGGLGGFGHGRGGFGHAGWGRGGWGRGERAGGWGWWRHDRRWWW